MILREKHYKMDSDVSCMPDDRIIVIYKNFMMRDL